MKNISFSFIICFLLFACSKDNITTSTTPVVVLDNFKPPYTVRYEVSFSANQVIPYSNTYIEYSYENNGVFHSFSEPGDGFVYLSNSELSGVWSRTFLVTVNINPLPLSIVTNFNPAHNAIVHFKIYVNNVLVKDMDASVSPNNNNSIDVLNGLHFNLF